ncbi:hypothetical protein Nepgr_008722 [Nepenthes gracilis]|uniref:Uncharacterized protein n=1 Tax=Nepenthes gracilis TaxID=150966 RepID=A0AAD3XJI0_NEPGR|nr:hypothetical protein Nepgr_008722 [Nepenthes gracilis]
MLNESSRKRVRLASSTSNGAGRLEDKVALIAGGANGLGKATAQEFIQHGARVFIADIDAESGRQVAENLGSKAHFVHCDVAIEANVARAVDIAVARHGKLDIMFNNVGIAGQAFPPSVADLDLDQFDRVMRINVQGTISGIKHAARVMIPACSGSILCMASICGILGGLAPHPYSISKFAISGIVKSVASELCQHGVRINCISPNPIPTAMVMEQFGLIYPNATAEKIREIVNGLGELKGAKCEEIDVARAALYLASDEAKYVSGHDLVVDGGFTAFKHLPLPSFDQLV